MNKDIIDLDEALERVEDDVDLLIELFEVFIEDYPLKMQAMRQATESSDFSQLADLAHSLKGASGNISAKTMRDVFIYIEQMAKDQKAQNINESLDKLDVLFDELKVYVVQMKEKL